MKTNKLLFVYNVKSDLFSSAIDAVHKIISPDTYPCALCRITYGTVKMKEEWKNFIENLPHKVEFLHKDEFKKQYPGMKAVALPAVFSKTEAGIKEIISAEEINRQSSIEDLKELVYKKIQD